MNDILKKLPTYEPPTTVWDAIETRLPLLEMPTYEPPIALWYSIENQLIIEKKAVNTPKILRGISWRTKLLAAASITILITATSYWVLKAKTDISEKMAVTTETIDNQLLVQEDKSIELEYQLVETFCKTALPVCEEPEFKTLKRALDELNSAHLDLKSAVSDYNSNPDLVAQLAHIENERAGILKKMMAKM
jgi:hypothetical protein